MTTGLPFLYRPLRVHVPLHWPQTATLLPTSSVNGNYSTPTSSSDFYMYSPPTVHMKPLTVQSAWSTFWISTRKKGLKRETFLAILCKTTNHKCLFLFLKNVSCVCENLWVWQSDTDTKSVSWQIFFSSDDKLKPTWQWYTSGRRTRASLTLPGSQTLNGCKRIPFGHQKQFSIMLTP